MSKKTCKPEASLNDYLLSILPAETQAQRLLREKTQREHPYKEMQVTPEQGAFLQWRIKTLGVKNIIEIGVFTGYSTLTMAQALPSDGKIIACDISQHWVSWGIPYWEMAHCQHKIDLRIARALETLQQLVVTQARSQDLIFVDADKPNYINYVKFILDNGLIQKRGIIVADNTLLQGEVYLEESERSKAGQAMSEFNEYLKNEPRVEQVLIPLRDGVTLAERKR